MPLQSDFAQVKPLSTVAFDDATSAMVQFLVPDTDLKLQIQAHAPGVFRLRCGEIKALEPSRPRARDLAHAEMLLAREEPVGEFLASSYYGKQNQGWILAQGDVELHIDADPLQFSLYRAGQLVIQTASQPTFLQDASLDNWKFELALTPQEAIHGLGDRQGSLDKRGQYFCSDNPEHRFLPLAWSTQGWGVYINSAGRVEHDVAQEQPDRYQIGVVEAPVFDLFLFVGDPSEILNQYTALTGRPGQSGLRPLGVWLDQAAGEPLEKTLELLNSLRESGFAVDAVQLASPAPFGFQDDKNSVDWDALRIADARQLFNRLEEQHVQLMAPTLPAVLAHTALFEEWEDRGWLLLNENSEAQIFEGNAVTDNQPFGLLDLTHKDAYRLWSDRIRQLVEEGLHAVSCSTQFDIPDEVEARGGEQGAVLRTLYPAIARQALFDAVAGHKTPQEGVVASCDLFPAAQRFIWQQGPQVENSWEGLESTLRHALALGDSGIVLQTHSLGNALANTDAMNSELYIRWLALCVFSGNFHLQGVPALLPTAFDEKTQALIQHWLQWRYRLIPYVLGIIEDSVRTGMPVQRSMAQAFPDDKLAQVWDTQYMFGPALLIAPVLKPGTKTHVYLPEGSAWWDVSTGRRYEGGTTWEIDAPLNTLPVFGREGHILSLGPTALHTGDFNSARILDEVWMFGMPEHSPVVMRNRIRVMQMQGSSYIKGLEGLRILPSEGLEVKRRGAEVRISRVR